MDHKLVRGVSLKLSFHSWFALEYRPRSFDGHMSEESQNNKQSCVLLESN